jgi:hypothetical protein
MKWNYFILVFFSLMVIGGCATMPTGPTVMVLPGPGKPFEVFQAEESQCRQWALQQIGGASPTQMANQNLATGAVVGTAVGAGMGALIGSTTGSAGTGAAIGAGAGLLGGSAMASGPAYSSSYQLQRRYDNAYMQCMYAQGNQIPNVAPHQTRAYAPPPPAPTRSQSQGSWVIVPGQYVNGKWVPEHRVQVPPASGEPAPAPGPPPLQQGPYAPQPQQ